MTNTPGSFLKIIDKVSLLRKFELFKNLNEDELQELACETAILKVNKNKYIYRTDDNADFLYVLINGTLKLGNTSHYGREVIRTILHPTALLGVCGLTNNNVHNSFAKTMESDVRLLKISVSGFTNIMKNNFSFNLKVIKNLGEKISTIEHRLESMVFNDARARIIEFIKENANKFGQKIGLETLLKHTLTQQEIANFTGTSRQTVTSVLNDLKSSNQIYFKRKSILIRDLSTLA
ncbi:MAG: Crp/Fnr family transcriptional regulator [Saprospiraceae bacterium]